MLRRLLTTLILTLTLAPGVTLAADPLAVRYYEDAVSRFNRGDTNGAVIQLKNALQRDPTQLPAKILLGEAYLKLGLTREAEEELVQAQQLGADRAVTVLPLARARNALGKYSTNIEEIVPVGFHPQLQADLWYELGIARMRTSDLDGARSAFEEALSVRPEHPDSLAGLARLQLQRGNSVEALELATTITADWPDSASAWFVRGAAAHGLGRFDEAAEAYARSYQLDPSKLGSGIGEAAALLDGDSPAKAVAILQSLRQEHPQSVSIPYLSWRAFTRLGREEEAEKALAEAATIVNAFSPNELVDRPKDLLLFGKVAFENGEYEQAFQFLNIYVERGGGDLRGRKMLANSLMALNRPTDALKILNRVSANLQADAEIMTMIGDANFQIGDYDAAVRSYRSALLNFGGGPAVIRRLALVEFRSGKRDTGISTLQGLVDIAPSGAAADSRLLLGFLYLRDGRVVEAEALAKELVSTKPKDQTARNFLAATWAAKGDSDAARALYEEILVEDPAFRPSRYNLIKLDIREGRYGDAERQLANLIARDTNDSQARYEFGRLELARGNGRAALAHLELAHELRPDDLGTARYLIDAYLAESRKIDALEVARAFKEKRPKDYKAQLELARAQGAAGEADAAIAALKQASLLAGNDPYALLEVGNRQLAAGAYDDAAWTFTKASAIAPEAGDVRYNLATSLYRAGRYEDAEAALTELQERYPDFQPAKYLLGDIRRAQGQYDEAISLYRSSLALQPETRGISGLFKALAASGRDKEAVAAANAWLADRPDDGEVLQLLGEHYLNGRLLDQARPVYERLAALYPRDPRVLNNLANVLSTVDAEGALKAALAAHELAPENPFVLDTLGWALVQIGDLERGLGYLNEARARNSRSPTVRFHTGVALQEFGKPRQALQEFRAALRLSKDFPERAESEMRIEQLQQLLR